MKQPELNHIYQGNCLDVMRTWPDECVDCVVTSPPYWNLRNYEIPSSHWPQIAFSPMPGLPVITIPEMECCYGLEESIEAYIGYSVLIFQEVFRVLKKAGTLWLNIGDSYASSGKNRTEKQATENSNLQGGLSSQLSILKQNKKSGSGIKQKNMIGVPWRMAFALQASEWYLRQDIIWAKPNPMPESVIDRCTRSHEYIFLFSKSKKYYFDQFAIAEQYKESTYSAFGRNRKGYGDGTGFVKSENYSSKKRKPKEWKRIPAGWDIRKGSHSTIDLNTENGRKMNTADKRTGGSGSGLHNRSGNYNTNGELLSTGYANKRDVWTISTQAFPGAHFATFPEKLIIPCILASCPDGGIVLDPFMGAGTTALVAKKLGRNYIGIEIKPEYIELTKDRLNEEIPLFKDVIYGA